MNESRTKIIATVGPASSAKETLRKMILSGVDVFRLNFSHGEHESHQSVIKKIKELRAEMQLNIAILADLQGPKIRTSNTPSNGIGLKEGAELSLYEGMEECSQDKIYITYSGLTKDLKAGEDVLIDDVKSF
ncbi:MAG: pyruvate kinase, partial [Marinilabiliales bacterium]